ncbi:unnamed protein product [Bursaphelenchus okinawaensis]|uniref:Uncharacterized protein n=1 Tax=Bursaphelenchus okinawaensis TaxID=465554 RepID=A0A811JUX7_9BILA|nr:unnamed protein product [Bursaphelenchus okinawaensis]CAG9085101.1 unnamed protein product [Bursaphelenchus okinawaensis]
MKGKSCKYVYILLKDEFVILQEENTGVLIYDTKKRKTVLEKQGNWSILPLFETVYNEDTREVIRYNKKSGN